MKVSSPFAKLRAPPGSAPWLLSHEIRMGWRRMSGGRLGRRTQFLLIAFLVGAWTLGSWIIFRPVAQMVGGPQISPMLVVGTSFAMIFIGAMVTSQAINGTIEAIYSRNDLDLLLASPIRPWTILIVRTLGVALAPLQFWAFLLAPPVLIMAGFGSPLWLMIFPTLVLLAFAATGLALLLATALLRLLGPRQTRVVTQVLAALIGGGVYLSAQAINLTRRGNADRPEEIAQLAQSIEINPYAPIFIPARAMLGDWTAILAWGGFALLLYMAGVRVFATRFVKDAAAIHAMGPARRRIDLTARPMHGGVSASLVRKEFRLLRRDPLLLARIGLSLVYFIPVLLVMATSGKDGAFAMPTQAMPGALTFFASTLAGSLIWVTVCAEDAPDLIASAPISRPRIERAKVFAAISPVLILFIAPLLLVGTKDPAASVLAAAGCVLGALSSSLIGIWRQAPIDRKMIMRRMPKETQVGAIGQMLVAAGLGATISLLSYKLPWFALITGLITAALFGAFYRSPEARAAAE